MTVNFSGMEIIDYLEVFENAERYSYHLAFFICDPAKKVTR